MLLQDKLWQLDKSWENNLVFYGINIPSIEEEEGNSTLVEDKVGEILRINLGIARDVPKRAFTGANIKFYATFSAQ